MQKRGQVTVFIIVGICIAIIFAWVYYSANLVAKEKSYVSTKKVYGFDVDPIKNYVETCLEKASEEGLWLVGIHGGYINPNGDPSYGEVGHKLSPSTSYNGEKVPYYSNGIKATYPSLSQIEEKLSRYIIVEFENCLDFSIFEEKGFNIEKPNVNYQAIGFNFNNVPVNSKVSISKEDVVIDIEYPLTIKNQDSVAKLSEFRISLPLRLGALYNGATSLITNIINSKNYNIAQYCDLYYTNRLKNDYVKLNDKGK